MSYYVPLYIENKYSNAFIVGLLLSISSFFGMFFDFFIAERLGGKKYKFFIFWTVAFALLFPLSLLVMPANVPVIALAMIVWSIYYEFRDFGKYDFVHHFMDIDKHTMAWSVISTLENIAYMIGPAIAVLALDKMFSLPLYVSIIFIGVTYGIFLLFKKKYCPVAELPLRHEVKKSFGQEINILFVLLKKLWLLVLVVFSYNLLDVVFWTSGILFAEQLRHKDALGGFFMVIYGVPALFVGFLAPFVHKKLGKKRTAFIFGVLAGLSMVMLALVNNTYLMLGCVFLAATFSGVSFILISAVYEDYVARASVVANDIVTTKQFAGNFAYVVGPVLLGFIAENFDLKFPFLITGNIMLLTSVIALIFIPRKIKMPQSELKNL